jgi:ABC-type amino acid transport substrate-binding protein
MPRLNRLHNVAVLLGMLLALPAWALRCGYAEGYPPFQYQDNGQAAGFDVRLLQKLAQQLNQPLELVAGRWDDIVARARLGQLDCVAGMEISPARQKWFSFTRPYYQRHINAFVRFDNTDLRTFSDLLGKIIAGDRDSAIEHELELLGIRQQIRMRQMPSKQQSMLLLQQGEVAAVIMPDAVAYHLAQQHGLNIRPLQRAQSPASPVAIAVTRRNAQLQQALDAALAHLLKSGEVARLWRVSCPKCGDLPLPHQPH